MVDKYKNFADLVANEPSNAYVIVREDRGSQVVIAAPHGGAIEPGTSEIARAIAGPDLSMYLFEGRKPDDNGDLHIASTQFDEPGALRLLNGATLVVTVHGAQGLEQVAYIGGRDQETGERIRQALERAGFKTAKHQSPWLQGVARENICNKGSSGAGVQLELSRGLRKTFFESLNCRSKPTDDLMRFANAVRAAIAAG